MDISDKVKYTQPTLPPTKTPAEATPSEPPVDDSVFDKPEVTTIPTEAPIDMPIDDSVFNEPNVTIVPSLPSEDMPPVGCNNSLKFGDSSFVGAPTKEEYDALVQAQKEAEEKQNEFIEKVNDFIDTYNFKDTAKDIQKYENGIAEFMQLLAQGSDKIKIAETPIISPEGLSNIYTYTMETEDGVIYSAQFSETENEFNNISFEDKNGKSNIFGADYDDDGKLDSYSIISNDKSSGMNLYYSDKNKDGKIDEQDTISIVARNDRTLHTQINPIITDGNIDSTKQGKIGDCWLLSGINALSYNEKGKEILKDSIEETNNGYSVNFKGLNKVIEVTKSELNNAINSGEYSKGDYDMLVFELAFEKAKVNKKSGVESSENDVSNHESLTGGLFEYVIEPLTGKKCEHVYNQINMNTSTDAFTNALSKPKQALFSFIDYISGNDLNSALDKIEKSDSIVAMVSFNPTFDNKARYVTDIYGNQHNTNAGGFHGWSVKSVDKDNVVIVNPWDSSNEITVSRKELNSVAFRVEYVDLSN